jgi:hypothetical protein
MTMTAEAFASSVVLFRSCLLFACLFLACASSAGMYCQQDADCKSGLICVKPPPDAVTNGATDGGGSNAGYGICQPALRGLGQTCLWTTECQPPLFCSNEIGDYLADDRHGTCQPRPPAALDMGRDLLSTDLSSGADAMLKD